MGCPSYLVLPLIFSCLFFVQSLDKWDVLVHIPQHSVDSLGSDGDPSGEATSTSTAQHKYTCCHQSHHQVHLCYYYSIPNSAAAIIEVTCGYCQQQHWEILPSKYHSRHPTNKQLTIFKFRLNILILKSCILLCFNVSNFLLNTSTRNRYYAITWIIISTT